MDGKTLLVAGVVLAGAYYIYKVNGKKLPTILEQYVAPTKRPDFPTALDFQLYRDPPASQDPTLPPIEQKGVCNVYNRQDFEGWSGNVLSSRIDDVDFGTILAGEKANAGCFSPPNKS
jgi:hypothetical protein